MALDSNVFGGIDEQAPSRLAQIFDPTVIQARNLQQAQMRGQEQQLQRASKLQQMLGSAQTGDPAQLSQQLAQGGFADEAMKYQGLADAQRQRQEAEVARRADTTRKAFGQVAAMGGDGNAVRKTLSQLPWMNPQQIEEAAAAADLIPVEQRQTHFLGLADPNYLAKRQEAEAARVEKGEQNAMALQERAAAAKLADQRHRETLAATAANRPQPAPSLTTIEDPNNPGKGIIIDARTGRRVGNALPNAAASAAAGSPAAKTADANEVLSLLDMAEPLVKQATGSYLGVGRDMAARAVGKSTDGGNAAAQLKALEGSIVAKMPKMSGPQSDADVKLYRQMAGQIGDPTIPAGQKLAAMKTIRDINQRNASPAASQPSAPKPSANKVLKFNPATGGFD